MPVNVSTESSVASTVIEPYGAAHESQYRPVEFFTVLAIDLGVAMDKSASAFSIATDEISATAGRLSPPGNLPIFENSKAMRDDPYGAGAEITKEPGVSVFRTGALSPTAM